MQAHLLRVPEEKSIRPVGSNQEIPVDVRIIAATNRKLEHQVNEGQFREDLFFRLNVLNLQIPPLRERLDDLKILTQHFIDSISVNLGFKPSTISSHELDLLSCYQWPGNIRELKNVIERSLLLNRLPSTCFGSETNNTAGTDSFVSLKLAEVEKQHILKVLDKESGNKSAAARLLGVSRKTLERKVAIWDKAPEK